jgi:ankyrin repeat protein
MIKLSSFFVVPVRRILWLILLVAITYFVLFVYCLREGALIDALRKSDFNRAKICLKMGGDVNRILMWGWKRKSTGQTILTNRIEFGSLRSVEFLLENGAYPNKPDGFGLTPAAQAAIRGDLEIISLLHNWGSDFTTVCNDQTPRELAESCKHYFAVDLIDKIVATKRE